MNTGGITIEEAGNDNVYGEKLRSVKGVYDTGDHN